MLLINVHARKRRKEMVDIRTFKGFEIKILSTPGYDFKYEWQIKPLSQTAKRRFKLLSQNRFARQDGPLKMLNDPTSHRFKDYAVDRAIERICEMRSPFWYQKS